jgi:hypothetical protein
MHEESLRVVSECVMRETFEVIGRSFSPQVYDNLDRISQNLGRNSIDD